MNLSPNEHPRRNSKLINIILGLLIVSIAGNIFLIYRAWDYRRGANDWLAKYTKVVEEFGRCEVYKNSDLKLQSDSVEVGRIVFFGTQVTEHWNLLRYFPGYEAINRGIGGQWVSGMLLRFWQDVVQLHPEYVVIEISSYNLRPQFDIEEIGQCLQAMVSIARQNGIKPILTTMVPIQKKHERIADYDRYLVTPHIRDYNNWLRAYATVDNLPVVEFDKILADPDGYLRADLAAGPIDPNEAGYALISDSINNILKRAQ